MDEHKDLVQLLQNIEQANRQQVKLTRLICVFALAAALCCGSTLWLVYSILPEIMEILPQISAVASQMQTVLSDLEQATRQLSVMDFTGMIEDVDTLVTTAQSSLDQTMSKLNSINFHALNQAIGDLAKVVEPMSKLMNVFG